MFPKPQTRDTVPFFPSPTTATIILNTIYILGHCPFSAPIGLALSSKCSVHYLELELAHVCA